MGRARPRASAAAKHGCLLAVGLAAWATTAQAARLVLQNDSAEVAVEPYASTDTIGSRAQLNASLGDLDTLLAASVERGARGWGVVEAPASWMSHDLRFEGGWSGLSDTRLTLDGGQRELWTQTQADPLLGADGQLAVNAERHLRLRADTHVDRLDLRFGAETSTAALDTRSLGQAKGVLAGMWTSSRKYSAGLAWRASPRVSIEASAAAQGFAAGWDSQDGAVAKESYLTPGLTTTLTPWTDGRWRLDAQRTVSPLDPAKFASYAQIASESGSAPRPDYGWRYGLQFEQALPGGIKLGAQAADWRLANVTELGPVGSGEAPVGIGPATRRQLTLNLAAPLDPVGLRRTTVAGELNLQRSQVLDPFTRQPRALSGEAPYSASLRLAGTLPAAALSWKLTATAEGPESLYQMAQVTSLGATAGLGGSLVYGSGPVKVALEVDNLLGGAREMTSLSYAGSRGDEALDAVARRTEISRAVRISLRRGL
jgi:hypothetical protein